MVGTYEKMLVIFSLVLSAVVSLLEKWRYSDLCWVYQVLSVLEEKSFHTYQRKSVYYGLSSLRCREINWKHLINQT